MAKRNEMKASLFSLVALAIYVVLTAQVESAAAAGSYDVLEPHVRQVVTEHMAANRGIGAGLIRLVFHDCFVRVTKAALAVAVVYEKHSLFSSLLDYVSVQLI